MRKRTLALVRLAVFAMTIFVMLPVVVSGQKEAGVKASFSPTKNYSNVGVIRKLVVHYTDESSEEIFAFESQDQDGMVRLTSGAGSNVDLDKYNSKQVLLNGLQELRTGKLTALSVNQLSPEDSRPQVKDGKLPMGQRTFDTDSKEFESYLSNFLTLPPPLPSVRMNYIAPMNFTDLLSTPLTQEELNSRIFTGSQTTNGQYSESDFYWQASGFKYRVIGEVEPWKTISLTSANCADNMFGAWTNARMAMIPNEIKAIYKRYTFVLPTIPGCAIDAIATVGAKGDETVNQYSWIPITGTRISNLSEFILTFEHEHAHNDGFQHPCGLIIATGGCSDTNDRADNVGVRLRYPNLYNRLSAGWFSGKLVTLNGPGIYDLNICSPAVTIKKPKGIMAPLYYANGTSSGLILLIEVRKDMNFYEFFPTQYYAYKTGVAIRRGSVDLTTNTSKSYLYDTTPNSPIGFDDAPLQVGLSFSDPQFGFTVQHISSSLSRCTALRVTLTHGP
jgi:hypothetical protein